MVAPPCGDVVSLSMDGAEGGRTKSSPGSLGSPGSPTTTATTSNVVSVSNCKSTEGGNKQKQAFRKANRKNGHDNMNKIPMSILLDFSKTVSSTSMTSIGSSDPIFPDAADAEADAEAEAHLDSDQEGACSPPSQKQQLDKGQPQPQPQPQQPRKEYILAAIDEAGQVSFSTSTTEAEAEATMEHQEKKERDNDNHDQDNDNHDQDNDNHDQDNDNQDTTKDTMEHDLISPKSTISNQMVIHFPRPKLSKMASQEGSSISLHPEDLFGSPQQQQNQNQTTPTLSAHHPRMLLRGGSNSQSTMPSLISFDSSQNISFSSMPSLVSMNSVQDLSVASSAAVNPPERIHEEEGDQDHDVTPVTSTHARTSSDSYFNDEDRDSFVGGADNDDDDTSTLGFSKAWDESSKSLHLTCIPPPVAYDNTNNDDSNATLTMDNTTRHRMAHRVARWNSSSDASPSSSLMAIRGHLKRALNFRTSQQQQQQQQQSKDLRWGTSSAESSSAPPSLGKMLQRTRSHCCTSLRHSLQVARPPRNSSSSSSLFASRSTNVNAIYPKNATNNPTDISPQQMLLARGHGTRHLESAPAATDYHQCRFQNPSLRTASM